jgi:hypothetical protein
MEEPKPVEDWPERPLSAVEATELLTDDVEAVWVMDHDDGVRSVTVGSDAPDDAIIDVIVETQAAFEMYSYTGGRWMDYGSQRKDDDGAPSMAGTLGSYRVHAGTSDVFE